MGAADDSFVRGALSSVRDGSLTLAFRRSGRAYFVDHNVRGFPPCGRGCARTLTSPAGIDQDDIVGRSAPAVVERRGRPVEACLPTQARSSLPCLSHLRPPYLTPSAQIYFRSQPALRPPGGGCRVIVRRDHLFEDAFAEVMKYPGEELRKRLMVSFKNEEGVDFGGVSRCVALLMRREGEGKCAGLTSRRRQGVLLHPLARDLQPELLPLRTGERR